MNKDRIVGAAKTVAGNIKQAVGKVVGDQKTVADFHSLAVTQATSLPISAMGAAVSGSLRWTPIVRQLAKVEPCP
jgi:hypothetical protein